MTIDRILGGIAVIFGGFLLLIAIPANVRDVQGAMPYPAMFPQMAAWMFIGLGAIQVLFVKSDIEIPSALRLFTFGTAAGLTLAALLVMDRFGYLPVSIALMVGITLMVRERRPLWALIAMVGLPVGIWLLFEQILHRPLP